MHPNCEFIGLALPCAGVLRCRVLIAAGAIAALSGCAQSPATSKTSTPAVLVAPPKQEEHASISPVETDADRPLTAGEVARKNQLEADLAAERPVQRLKLRNGRVFDGRVVSETPSTIRFRDGFGYSGFVTETYRRADVVAVETLPVTSVALTASDVRFSAEFPEFHFVKSPPYTVVTDESYGEVQKILGVLTDLREQFHTHFSPLIEKDAELQDIHVVFFGAEDAFRRYALRVAPFFVNSAGFFSSAENRLALLNQLSTTRYAQAEDRLHERDQRFAGDPDIGVQLAALRSGVTSEAKSLNERLVRHEGAHQLFHAYHIHSRYGLEPTWLTEGLAQYCETSEIGRYHTALAERVIRARRSGHLLPLKTLLNHRDSSGFFALGEDNVELAYAESWALVYMLMQDSSRARFFDYVKSYRDVSTYRDVAAVERAEPETLLEARLQMDFNSLQRQWDSFLIHI